MIPFLLNVLNSITHFIKLHASVVSDSLRPYGLRPTRLLCLWGFSRQEYWSGLPCSPPGDLPNPRIKPKSPVLQAGSLPSEPPGKPRVVHNRANVKLNHVGFYRQIFLFTHKTSCSETFCQYFVKSSCKQKYMKKRWRS